MLLLCNIRDCFEKLEIKDSEIKISDINHIECMVSFKLHCARVYLLANASDLGRMFPPVVSVLPHPARQRSIASKICCKLPL